MLPEDHILDTISLGTAPTDKSDTNIYFGFTFGIPMEQQDNHSFITRELTNPELMKL